MALTAYAPKGFKVWALKKKNLTAALVGMYFTLMVFMNLLSSISYLKLPNRLQASPRL